MIIDIDVKMSVSKSYKVYINELNQNISIQGKACIITNTTVSKIYLDEISNIVSAKELYTVVIPDGEEYKNLETIEFILDKLFEYKLDRKTTLIALGGGVVGDITGFVSSIYQRGIDFIQMPTTLLSQVDASVGGKTGVNNRFGKNLVGTFHQPVAVYCESRFLKTLPKREFNSGIAEVIKMSVMFDNTFFTWLENNNLKSQENIEYVIDRCVSIKAKIVELDEKESGVRAVLNYGHTFGHVIEKETDYKTYLHGEAVSIGIVMANKLAQKLELLSQEDFQRIEKLLMKFDLPVKYKIKNVDNFYNSFFLDKKSNNSQISFILPNEIGNNVIKKDIEEGIVKSVLEEFNS